MKLRLKTQYNTVPGQQIYVSGNSKILGNWNLPKAVKMNYSNGGHWSVEIEIPDSTKQLEYKYVMADDQGNVSWEFGDNRVISLKGKKPAFIHAEETWHAPSKEEKPLYTSAFTRVVMHPDGLQKSTVSKAKQRLEFRINAPRVQTGLQVCILGNHSKLGNWKKDQPLLLDCEDHFPLWKGSISMAGLKFPLEYKYGLYDTIKKEVVKLEEGINRFIAKPEIDEKEFLYIKSDEGFRHLSKNWRGAGVAVPVFSLKTQKSFGVGDFKDLMDFIDWAEQTSLKMVQILPINETIASHNWLDSYPYKSISVMALHPMYLNLESMGTLKDKKEQKNFQDLQEILNAELHVNYPKVMTWKSRYFKMLFDQEKESFFESEDYKKFFEANKSWLVPYAAFVYLRDKNSSPDFRQWGKY
ncbi:MAG: 4-alpha-glucanotransferase, partial [Bacteroidetes bacterium]